jgi:hypothetical protein
VDERTLSKQHSVPVISFVSHVWVVIDLLVDVGGMRFEREKLTSGCLYRPPYHVKCHPS